MKKITQKLQFLHFANKIGHSSKSSSIQKSKIILTSCKNFEPFLFIFLRQTNRRERSDRQMNKRSDRQTDRQKREREIRQKLRERLDRQVDKREKDQTDR